MIKHSNSPSRSAHFSCGAGILSLLSSATRSVHKRVPDAPGLSRQTGRLFMLVVIVCYSCEHVHGFDPNQKADEFSDLIVEFSANYKAIEDLIAMEHAADRAERPPDIAPFTAQDTAEMDLRQGLQILLESPIPEYQSVARLTVAKVMASDNEIAAHVLFPIIERHRNDPEIASLENTEHVIRILEQTQHEWIVEEAIALVRNLKFTESQLGRLKEVARTAKERAWKKHLIGIGPNWKVWRGYLEALAVAKGPAAYDEMKEFVLNVNPTGVEFGIHSYDPRDYWGILFATKSPRAEVDILHDLRTIHAQTDMNARVGNMGYSNEDMLTIGVIFLDTHMRVPRPAPTMGEDHLPEFVAFLVHLSNDSRLRPENRLVSRGLLVKVIANDPSIVDKASVHCSDAEKAWMSTELGREVQGQKTINQKVLDRAAKNAAAVPHSQPPHEHVVKNWQVRFKNHFGVESW